MIYQQIREYHGEEIKKLLLHLLEVNPEHKLVVTTSELMSLVGIVNDDYIRYYDDKEKLVGETDVEVEYIQEVYSMLDTYREIVENEVMSLRNEGIIDLTLIPLVNSDSTITCKYEIIYNKHKEDFMLSKDDVINIMDNLNKSILEEILSTIESNNQMHMRLGEIENNINKNGIENMILNMDNVEDNVFNMFDMDIYI